MVRPTVPDVGTHAVEGVPEPQMNSAQRRKLGDITNFPNKTKLMNRGAKEQQQAILLSYKENAEKLQKENIAQKKVLVEKDKTIKLSEVELQKLRNNLRKFQEQNLQLAQRNDHMLGEVNTSKDQLKVLRHELSCKNGLIMARKILLKEQNLPCTRNASEDKARPSSPGRASKTFQPNGADHNNASESSNVKSAQTKEKTNKRRSSLSLAQSGRSETLETGETENLHEVVDANETKENARVSLRKRSARVNYQQLSPPESFHESIQTTKKQRRVSSKRQPTKVTEESTDPPLQDDIVEKSSLVSTELKSESKNEPRGDQTEVMRRPTRQAAEKVGSYREASLKEKMRRDF